MQHKLGLMQLRPQSSSQRHFLLGPLQSSWTTHFLRQVWLPPDVTPAFSELFAESPGKAPASRELFVLSLRVPLRQRVALISSSWMWLDTRPAPGRFLPPRFLPASVSAQPYTNRQSNLARAASHRHATSVMFLYFFTIGKIPPPLLPSPSQYADRDPI